MLHTYEVTNQDIRTTWEPHIQEKRNHSYLLEFAISRSHKRHGVAAVIVSRHRRHAIVFIYEEGDAFNGAGPTQGLVEVLTAEVIIYLQWLEERRTENNQTKQ